VSERDWYTSSFCNDQESACVEVRTGPGGAAVRDSTDPDGPVLTFGPEEWGAFVRALSRAEDR